MAKIFERGETDEGVPTVTIAEREYNFLEKNYRKLLELESNGVDNWSGYEEIDWDYINTGERG
jgi:hypothetical protein